MLKLAVLGLASVGFLSACGKAASFNTSTQESVTSASSAGDGQTVNEVIAPPKSNVPSASPGLTGALQNFVAGSKYDCEASIARKFGRVVSCSVGGGCSLDGFVPSAGRPSANPGLYGACISPSSMSSTVVPPPAQRRNVVAGDQATCDQVVRSLKSGVYCSVGGGCALDGSFPSNSNPSANPGLPGACFDL